MASRRLDISSLLCNDYMSDSHISNPVILAPHLRQPSHNMLHSTRPPNNFGLEALVHVATQERRRLSDSHLPSTGRKSDPGPPQRRKHLALQELMTPDPPPSVPPDDVPNPTEQDAHEWFLHHFDDYNPPPPTPTPSQHEIDPPNLHLSCHPDNPKSAMQVDVQHELLSLLDDQPPRPPPSEPESMPPPTTVAPPAPNKKKKSRTNSKATPLVSAGTKPRPRPGPKSKSKFSDPSKPKPNKHNTPRSRSTSLMPNNPDAIPEKQDEDEDSDQEDDKLYCVCKTTYDDDRFMIACDRCDEWYHTQCVNMPDLEVDLVDQFICPPCIDKYPHLNLCTTYKTRCAYGLAHCDPSSPDACHRPARGAFSKYCSDECGLKCMKPRVDAWVKNGGKKDKLWEVVKDAEKREGVVVCAGEQHLKPNKSKSEREIARLNGLLVSVVKLREDVKKEMEFVVWREKVLELAMMRAELTDQCGWDHRLCFADDQCADLGARVLESYDGDKDGDWWCSGKKVCDRHAGWQAIRVKDVCKEKEKKNDALSNLTTREREIRKRIEDLLEPRNDTSGKSPLTVSNAKLSNGHTKAKVNGDMTTTKKGKKRKAPS